MAKEYLKPETYKGYFIRFNYNWFGMGVQGTAYKGGKVMASAGGSSKEEVMQKMRLLLR